LKLLEEISPLSVGRDQLKALIDHPNRRSLPCLPTVKVLVLVIVQWIEPFYLDEHCHDLFILADIFPFLEHLEVVLGSSHRSIDLETFEGQFQPLLKEHFAHLVSAKFSVATSYDEMSKKCGLDNPSIY